MPIFSYLCKKCGHTFDLLEGMTVEKVERKCPECASKNIKKTLSGFSVGSSSGLSCPTGTCPL
ncbi:MAG: zinc ribbon domain-containing protein [Candidatus Euphemobacter frigidus]|nr:zinc ribbon domain-containing protein [Candidatus Euphemobacter frigidus]